MKSRIKCYNILHNKLKNMTSEMLNNIFIQGIEKKYKNNSYTKISGYDVFMKKIPFKIKHGFILNAVAVNRKTTYFYTHRTINYFRI